MTSSDGYHPGQATSDRLAQLAAGFDRVRDPRDWKAPIRAVILATDRPLVEKAVLWFTNVPPTFQAVPGEADRLVVMGPGYRIGQVGSSLDQTGPAGMAFGLK
jgi:hypothetical protein